MDSFDITLVVIWVLGVIIIIFTPLLEGRKSMIPPEQVAKGQSLLRKFAQEAENYALIHDALDMGAITEKDDLRAKNTYDTAYAKLDAFIQNLGKSNNE